MLGVDLKTILNEVGLSQTDFARLVGVTPRAVTLWMVGDRNIPGPVEAYARLLHSVPLSVRQVELQRLNLKTAVSQHWWQSEECFRGFFRAERRERQH
jgi:predicted transcriptional regulator